MDGSRDIFYGTRQKNERIDYAVRGGHGSLGDIYVEEFHGSPMIGECQACCG